MKSSLLDFYREIVNSEKSFGIDYKNLSKQLIERIDKAIDWCNEIIRTFCEDDKQVVVAYEIKEILGDKENE